MAEMAFISSGLSYHLSISFRRIATVPPGGGVPSRYLKVGRGSPGAVAGCTDNGALVYVTGANQAVWPSVSIFHSRMTQRRRSRLGSRWLYLVST